MKATIRPWTSRTASGTGAATGLGCTSGCDCACCCWTAAVVGPAGLAPPCGGWAPAPAAGLAERRAPEMIFVPAAVVAAASEGEAGLGGAARMAVTIAALMR